MDFHVLRFSGKSKKENEKKIYIYQLGIFNENPPWGQIFQRPNPFLLFIFYCKSAFQNFNPDLPIKSTQNFSAVFPILAVILDSFEQKYDYFYIVNNFKAFRLTPSSTARFFKIGSSMSSLRVAVLGEGRGGYGYTQANPCLHFLGNFLTDNNT